MKKITLVLLLASASYFASAQLYPTVWEQLGNVKPPGQVIDNPNRSVPPGTLIYSQPFACPPYNGLRSEVNFTNSETADDFIVTTSTSVNIVRWWFWMADDPYTTGWIIRFYDNQDCLPSTLIGTWNIAAGAVNYEFVCNPGFPVYDCWAYLTPAFSPLSNVNYWISIQAVGSDEFWSTTGNPGEYQNCSGAFKSTFFGAPDFVPDPPFIGNVPADFAFELYSGGTAPGEVPISNWAIVLGIFLILVAGLLRFRRMI